MKKLTFCITLVASMSFIGCADEHQYLTQVLKATEGQVKIKFIHAASDTVGVNLFFDEIKLTGNSPSTITTYGAANIGKVNIGTVGYSATFPVTDYALTDKTSGQFSVVFPESYSNDLTFNEKVLTSKESGILSASSYYTVAFVGITNSYELAIFEDNLDNTPINGKAYVRFGNFIHNSVDKITIRATPPSTTEDPTPAEIILFSDVSYKSMSDFIELPRTGTYTNVRIYNAATNALIATLAAAQSAFIDNKVYTLIARGQIGGTSTRVPTVTRLINR